MRRRQFLTLVGGFASAHASPSTAQQLKRLPVVAMVNPTIPLSNTIGSDPIATLPRAFVHGLRDLGWIDGRTVIIERRSAEGDPQRAPAIMAELVALGVDVIMLGGLRWLHHAALAATRSVPIVAMFTDNPVATGLIASLARPGGNLTGVTLATGAEFQSKRLQLLTEIAPMIARVAFLAPHEVLEQYRSAVPRPGVAVIPFQVDSPQQYSDAFAAVLAAGADGLMVGGGLHYGNAQRIAAFATQNRLPAIYPWREAVDAGGLISYGTNVAATWGQAARLVDRFLRGAKIGEVPTEQPTKFELVINANSAKALALTIPPNLIGLADEVIE